jgi:pimeloyl-ACP methyl ester carboxylesterase
MRSLMFGRFSATLSAIGLALLLTSSAAADSAPAHDRSPSEKPTIVLVHGAFADSSSWSTVIDRLQDHGFQVIAPANPLRGVGSDSAYMATVLDTLTGPLVLVGHSYGGIIISNAAAMTRNAANVKALVYVAAFIPEVGEAAQNLSPLPGSLINSDT